MSITDFCGSLRKVPGSFLSHGFSQFIKKFSLVLTGINYRSNVSHITTKERKKAKRSDKNELAFGNIAGKF